MPEGTTFTRPRIRTDADLFGPYLRRFLHGLGIATVGLPVCSATGRTGEDVPGGVPALVGMVKDFIDAHAYEDIDLDRIAVAAGVSKFHLVRVFHEATGQTPWSYVRDVRVQKARELLDTDLPLADIALEAGFFDQSHFTRTFRSAEGVPPGRYRRRRKIVQDREAVHS